ncbi:MAG TPA: hypothetical protein VIG37_26625 [Methylomirabilota bacterium]
MPVVTGVEPVTLSWLWALHSEHRILLPRVISLGLYNRVMGYDFRSGIVFNAVALSVVALAMIVAVKRLRGWTTYPDAFFPLAFLHWGVGALERSFYLNFVSSTVLASSFMLLFVRYGTFSTLSCALLGGFFVLLLPTTGANGLALAPCLVLFLGYSGLRQWQLGTLASRRLAVVTFSFGVGCLLLSGLYFVGYDRSLSPTYASAGIGSLLKAALMFSAAGFAPDGLERWPWWEWWRLVVPTLLTLTVILLVRRLVTKRSERDRIVGYLLFLAALATLAATVGLGRGGLVWRHNLDFHYSTLALPLLCLVYFAWEAYGSPPASRLVEMCLFAVMCGVFVLNGPPLRYLGGMNLAAAEVQRDVLAGVSRCALAEQHLHLFWWYDTEEGRRRGIHTVADGLSLLRRVGVAPFQLLRDDQANERC